MKTIILVDDDMGILEVFKIVFERAGYLVTALSNGGVLFENNFDEPDIFILDRHLGPVDGLDLCRHLKQREKLSATPVIMFSASPYVNQQAREAGADDFIEKPFKTRELLDMLEKHLNDSALDA